MGLLTDMTYFSASSFDLSGPIGGVFAGWSKATRVYLQDNQLTGPLPADLDKETPSLLTLDMSDNQLEGEIPTSLGGLSNLEELNLAGNMLRGKINSSVGRLGSLSKYTCPLNRRMQYDFFR